MRPTIIDVHAVGGTIEPALPQPRWLVYGDSVAEGWVASGPSAAWPAVAGRALGLDVVNCGYAGSARGEVASAEQLATVHAEVISVSHGTNCWARTPHSAGMIREGTAGFLSILRQGHPGVPIVVVSPVVRPDSEAIPNRLGATLADIRTAMEDAATTLGDPLLSVLPGGALLEPAHLPDGIHPGDEGHRILAAAIGGTVARALAGRR
jgi:lysophospholipase L1-like esterase